MQQHVFLDPPPGRSIDSLPVRTATPDHLDLHKVEVHIARATASGRYRGPADPYTYLLQKQCLVRVDDQFYATLAGLLCFGRHPQAMFPGAVVHVGQYRGVDPVSYEVAHSEKDIGGTIFEQLARVEAYLWTNTCHSVTTTGDSVQRSEAHAYPGSVIRELCVNLLAHRDYAGSQPARILLFHNRIEWVSPGSLPLGITVHNILDEQAPRNPVLLSILYEAGYKGGFGQGLDKVVALLEHEALPAPSFRDTGASFIVTAYGRQFRLVADDAVHSDLNEAQREILKFIRSRGTVAPRDIQALLSKRARRSIQRDIKGLVDAKLITTIGESRALRYRLSDAFS